MSILTHEVEVQVPLFDGAFTEKKKRRKARGAVAAETRIFSKRQIARNKAVRQFKRELHKEGNRECEACGWSPVPEFLTAYPAKRPCKRVLPCLHIHHVVPATCGGSDAEENLVQLCPNCHSYADIMADRIARTNHDNTRRVKRHAKSELIESLRLLNTNPQKWLDELNSQRRQDVRSILDRERVPR